MKCKKTQQVLVDYYYQELNGPGMLEITRHLETCSACRQAYARIKKTLAMVSKEQLEEDKSSAFWQDFQYKVYLKLEAEKMARSWWQGLLVLRRVVPTLAGAVILLLIIVTSTRLVNHRSEMTSADVQIAQELELIENYELIQDLEMLENLPEAEPLRG